jgi:hypothetical protein
LTEIHAGSTGLGFEQAVRAGGADLMTLCILDVNEDQ